MARKRLGTVSPAFGPFRPLLIGTVLLLTCLSGAAFVNGSPSDGLNAVILACFAYGVGQWLWATAYLVLESWRTRRVVNRLEGETIEAVLASGGHRGRFLAVVRGLNHQHQTHPGSIDAGGLLSAMDLRLRERNERAALSAQLLVTLGVLGTVIGLMAMMTGMSASVHAADKDASKSLMSVLFGPDGPLSGLSTAFTTTLLGTLFGGIVLRMLTASTARATDRLMVQCDELISVYILPALRAGTRETKP
jgi:MotA/TolQ/ExbB proton channel family